MDVAPFPPLIHKPTPAADRPLSPHHILISGAVAGLAVDLILFPLDTIKTRLQSKEGFVASGGFRSIYSGTTSVAIGSAPGSAFFFCAYEGVKNLLHNAPFFRDHISLTHMVAASAGEVFACLVRVPTEIVKQRAQARPDQSVTYIFNELRNKGRILDFYRGFGSTVLREIPFSIMQFPLWEWFKLKWLQHENEAGGDSKFLSPWKSAICGCVSGAISAAITTPMDVAKTRIMLNRSVGRESYTIRMALASVYRQRGIAGLYAGVAPRTLAIGVGGFIFFGAYDSAQKVCRNLFAKDPNLPDWEEVRPIERFLEPFERGRPETFEEMRSRSKAAAEGEPRLKRGYF